MSTCRVCMTRMIPVDGYTEHPACSQTDPNARIIRDQYEAALTRDAGIRATQRGNPGAMTTAVQIIQRAAEERHLLSANTVRAAMTDAAIPKTVIGAAFRQAVKDGLIVADGYIASSDKATHAHHISQYRSGIWRAA